MFKICSIAFYQAMLLIARIDTGLLLSSVSASELSRYRKEHQLRKAVCLLSQTDYQLLCVKKPQTTESGMAAAILWQEQARFFLPIDQLLVEYVHCPSLGKEERVYAVAISKRLLTERYRLLNDSGLQLAKITIPEFVYAQYVQKYYSKEDVVIWVNCFSDGVQALAFYRGELVSMLKLPSLSASALHLFYSSDVKEFSLLPLWLFNTAVDVDKEALDVLSGSKHFLRHDVLQSQKISAASHAYYGAMLYE